MRAAQTIRRLSNACLWLALLVGCEPKRKRPEPHKAPEHERVRPMPSASAAQNSSAALAAAAVAETLRSVHEQRLEITPLADLADRLAFGPGRLLQAATNKVILRDVQQGDALVDTALEGVRAVALGSDGALFAVGALGGVRFVPHGNAHVGFPHVTFFPGAGLFPDLEDPNEFYVYASGEPQLYRYPFTAEASAFLAMDAQIPMADCQAVVGLLRDGAFVCRTTTGLARHAPRGSHTAFKLPKGFAEPFRLLAAKRLDELFSVDASGLVVHWRLGAGLPELAHFQLPAPPYAAASNGESLAFVLVSAPEPEQARRWSLLVTDFTGQPRFQSELSAQSAPAGEDWEEAVTEDKNLAISGFEPLVAVGGADHVQVWNYAEARALFDR
jgi:hypothetical protein